MEKWPKTVILPLLSIFFVWIHHSCLVDKVSALVPSNSAIKILRCVNIHFVFTSGTYWQFNPCLKYASTLHVHSDQTAQQQKSNQGPKLIQVRYLFSKITFESLPESERQIQIWRLDKSIFRNSACWWFNLCCFCVLFKVQLLLLYLPIFCNTSTWRSPNFLFFFALLLFSDCLQNGVSGKPLVAPYRYMPYDILPSEGWDQLAHPLSLGLGPRL